eukprot:806045-Pelagomonas_calceolata.AAC.2
MQGDTCNMRVTWNNNAGEACASCRKGAGVRGKYKNVGKKNKKFGGSKHVPLTEKEWGVRLKPPPLFFIRRGNLHVWATKEQQFVAKVRKVLEGIEDLALKKRAKKCHQGASTSEKNCKSQMLPHTHLLPVLPASNTIA